MKKILILLLINLIYLSAETITPKRVKAKDRIERRGSHHHSSGNIEQDVLFSSSEITGQISFELSIQLSTEATSYSTTEERRRNRGNYIESNRKEIDMDMAKGEGEHLSTLLQLLEIKEEKSFLVKIQNNFNKLNRLNNQELSEKLIAMKS